MPWQRPWKNGGSARGSSMPHNVVSGRPYHGVNVLLLGCAEMAHGYQSPCWLTFKQAQDKGGHVRKGEKGQIITFWKFNRRTVKGADGKPLITDDGEQVTAAAPMLRTYYVFNVAQCEGIEVPPPPPPVVIPKPALAARIERLGAVIQHGGDRACYSPLGDSVSIPRPEQFVSEDLYWSTLLHELTHWTGHKARCDRKILNRFGSEAYAAEELVAEIGSAFLCASFGIPLDELQHPEYVENWLSVLRGDNRAIFTASRLAQVAADFIIDNSAEAVDAAAA